jgi:hypothetical protein
MMDLGYDIIIFASDVQCAAIFGMRRLLYKLREKRTGEFFSRYSRLPGTRGHYQFRLLFPIAGTLSASGLGGWRGYGML